MRSPGWKLATCEIGSDLPLRETFISTRGPSKSKGATSAARAGQATARNAVSSSAPDPVFVVVLAWEAENTPASLSGLGVWFLRNFDRASIIARQENTPTISGGNSFP